METDFIEAVYQTMLGNMIIPVPMVENAFADGKPCDNYYTEVDRAYERLRSRLNVEDEDDDVETIISAMLSIQRYLCFRMYEYGNQLGRTDIENK